uniref:C-type lectin domain-containing protein n=1 Tax=Oryzias latipes TaxID=8090 RepID=A0A3P9KB32_ORYLA
MLLQCLTTVIKLLPKLLHEEKKAKGADLSSKSDKSNICVTKYCNISSHRPVLMSFSKCGFSVLSKFPKREWFRHAVTAFLHLQLDDSSLKVSHSAALKLISELTDLRSNHSDLIEAEEEAKRLVQMKIQDHVKLKEQIQELTVLNSDYQRQFEALLTDKERETCGRCPPSWIHLNSSCYFFSYTESSSNQKTWQDSRTDCIRREADLIVIDSPKFVSSTIHSIAEGSRFWIGLTDKVIEGRWVWINNVTEVEQRWETLNIILSFLSLLFFNTNLLYFLKLAKMATVANSPHARVSNSTTSNSNILYRVACH